MSGGWSPSMHVLLALAGRGDVVLPAALHVAGGPVVADDDALALAVLGLSHAQLFAALPHHLAEVTCQNQQHLCQVTCQTDHQLAEVTCQNHQHLREVTNYKHLCEVACQNNENLCEVTCQTDHYLTGDLSEPSTPA